MKKSILIASFVAILFYCSVIGEAFAETKTIRIKDPEAFARAVSVMRRITQAKKKGALPSASKLFSGKQNSNAAVAKSAVMTVEEKQDEDMKSSMTTSGKKER